MNPLRPGRPALLVAAIAAVAAIVLVWPVMDMVLLGASLAVVLMPLHQRICSRLRPSVSALLVGVWLENPATNPADFGVPLPKSALASALTVGFELFVRYQQVFFSYLPVIALKVSVFALSLFILLYRGMAIWTALLGRLPAAAVPYVDRLARVSVDTLYAIYVVQLAISALTFFISIPVFLLLGYGDVLFYSFLSAFCEFIPVFGSSVAFIVVGAYAFALGDIRGVFILFFLGWFCVSALPEIFFRPVLMGRRVRIHPVVMFVGFIGGIITLGLAGFVLGPLALVWLMTLHKMRREERAKASP
jgi:predicted PurR-regulated permease PerM